ncbi:unnamed protein product [Caenorhabditis angaria]|uniref:Tyrosine-protein phosphatase domain-containing protein n=1 Tax=Caenorhabditis angaria TaxID=860376 RepID=A0A9P1J0M7_9PELO|nr:unnamed protein product [Caenorhabditis angaria]
MVKKSKSVGKSPTITKTAKKDGKKEEKSKVKTKTVRKSSNPESARRKKQNKDHSRELTATVSNTTIETPVKTENSAMNLVQSTRHNGKKPKEKWAGEAAAKAWVKTLETVNLTAEYDEIKKMVVQVERCRIWQANMNRNRHPEYRCFDDNRVVVQMTKCDYINASKISVPDFPKISYLVQIPKLDQIDAVEEFWRMIFTEQCSSIHVIAQPKELDGGNFAKFFAQEAGQYFYANGFFVNTKKVERNPEDKMDIYTVELLPDGCSNSVVCQVYTHSYWKAQGGPEKFYAPIRAATAIAKVDELDKSPVALVSFRGAGRNASLLTLATIVSHFTKGITPNISNIVHAIRDQRPMSVDNFTQYQSIYLATCWLIKAKVTNCEDVAQRLKKFREKFEMAQSSTNATTDKNE